MPQPLRTPLATGPLTGHARIQPLDGVQWTFALVTAVNLPGRHEPARNATMTLSVPSSGAELRAPLEHLTRPFRSIEQQISGQGGERALWRFRQQAANALVASEMPIVVHAPEGESASRPRDLFCARTATPPHVKRFSGPGQSRRLHQHVIKHLGRPAQAEALREMRLTPELRSLVQAALVRLRREEGVHRITSAWPLVEAYTALGASLYRGAASAYLHIHFDGRPPTAALAAARDTWSGLMRIAQGVRLTAGSDAMHVVGYGAGAGRPRVRSIAKAHGADMPLGWATTHVGVHDLDDEAARLARIPGLHVAVYP